jgi:hypothetical protein
VKLNSLLLQEFAELARSHYQHDLTSEDRELIQKAGQRIGIYSTIGASLGLGLGLFLSLRIRRTGFQTYNAAKKAERPVAVQFKDGHTGESVLIGQYYSILLYD